MKKITLFGLFLFSSLITQAGIVVRDIPDFTFTAGSNLNLDFNNDGTPEFSLTEMGGPVGSFFDPTSVNFVGTGTFASGSGWDVMKFLTYGTAIGASSSFDAQADCYINPSWASPSEMFPNGDSYIGTTFKIGANRYYGWILVNVNSGLVTLKSYAYNNISNQNINAGQTTSLSVYEETRSDFYFYPNPANDYITFKTDLIIVSATAIDINGKHIPLEINHNTIITEKLEKGIYVLNLSFSENKKLTKKLLKN